MMLSCRETARLLSESLERPLPFWKRLALRFHLLMCKYCAGYEVDLHAIRRAAQREGAEPAAGQREGLTTLSDNVRRQIKQRLADEAN